MWSGTGFLGEGSRVDTNGKRAGQGTRGLTGLEGKVDCFLGVHLLAQESGTDGQQKDITSFHILTSPLLVRCWLATPFYRQCQAKVSQTGFGDTAMVHLLNVLRFSSVDPTAFLCQ
jgi:hypothetical protein